MADEQEKQTSLLSGKLNFLSKITRKATSEEVEQQKETRKVISKQVKRLDLTIGILEQNIDLIREMAENDEEARELLSNIESGQTVQLQELGNKISSGQEVSSREGKQFVKQFQNFSSALEGFKGELSTNFGFLTKQFSEIISNDELDVESRRQSLKQLQQIAQSNQIQTQLSETQKSKLNELISLDTKNLSFNKKEGKGINKLLFDLADDTTDIKIQGTLDNLNRNLQESTLTSEEIQDALEKDVGDGRKLSETLEEGLSSEIGQGFLDAILPGFGSIFSLGKDVFSMGAGTFRAGGKVLGGLSKGVAGAVGKGVGLLGKGAGGILGGAAKGIGGIAGGIGGALKGGGGLLKGLARGAKFLGPIAALGMGAFDFSQGFGDAENIAGLEEGKEANLGQKIQAGLSSAASGLTFGLVDPKTVYEGIEGGLDFLFGDDGILKGTADTLKSVASSIGDFIGFDNIKKSFMAIFSADGLMGKVRAFGDFLLEGPSKLISNVMDSVSNGFDAVFGENGPLSHLTMLLDKISNIDISSLVPDSVSDFLGFGGDDGDKEQKSEGGFLSSVFGGETSQSASTLSSAKVSAKPVKFDGQSTIISQKQDKEDRDFKRMMMQQQQNQQNPVVIGQVSGGSGMGSGQAVSKQSEVNDMKLSSLNLSLMD